MNYLTKYIYKKEMLNHELISILYPVNEKAILGFNINLSFSIYVKNLPIIFRLKDDSKKEYFISIEAERVDAVFENKNICFNNFYQFIIEEIETPFDGNITQYKEWTIGEKIIAINAFGLSKRKLMSCKGWNNNNDFIRDIYLKLQGGSLLTLTSSVDKKTESDLYISSNFDETYNYKESAKYFGFDEF